MSKTFKVKDDRFIVNKNKSSFQILVEISNVFAISKNNDPHQGYSYLRLKSWVFIEYCRIPRVRDHCFELRSQKVSYLKRLFLISVKVSYTLVLCFCIKPLSVVTADVRCILYKEHYIVLSINYSVFIYANIYWHRNFLKNK